MNCASELKLAALVDHLGIDHNIYPIKVEPERGSIDFVWRLPTKEYLSNPHLTWPRRLVAFQSCHYLVNILKRDGVWYMWVNILGGKEDAKGSQ